MTFDVAIIGGGPAGIAAAITLARTGRSVALFERRPDSAFRVGETLAAEAGPLLTELGAFDRIAPLLAAEQPFTLVRSAWGDTTLDERPSILHPLGAGWHVDRVRFDGALLDHARELGVTVFNDLGRARPERASTSEASGFVIDAPRLGRPAVHATELIDASGRGADAITRLGGGPTPRWLAFDRQVALVAKVARGGSSSAARADGHDTPALVLEAVEDGFWYTAPLADGALVAAWVTDADLLHRYGRTKAERFQAALAKTGHTRARLEGHGQIEDLAVFRSESGLLSTDHGDGWRALGDAAMSTDPLGGQGITRALRAGLLAASPRAATVDGAARRREVTAYLDTRARYYGLEPRFSRAPYWARRRMTAPAGDEPIDWREVELWLAPDTPLTWRRDPDARAESWLPPSSLEAIRSLPPSSPAHRLLATLGALLPVEPRRLLVALQWLVSDGALDVR